MNRTLYHSKTLHESICHSCKSYSVRQFLNVKKNRNEHFFTRANAAGEQTYDRAISFHEDLDYSTLK